MNETNVTLMRNPQYMPDGSYNWTASGFQEQPSTKLAGIAAVVYFILFVLHILQAFKFKTKYMTAAIAGAFFEAVGYVTRIVSINSPFNIPIYSAQYSFIIVSPVLIAATQYVMLEKVIEHSYPKSSPIRHNWITRIFVICDIVAFLVQVMGSSVLLSDRSKTQTGLNILMLGLCIQVASFAVYMGIAIVFFRRARLLDANPAFSAAASGWKTVFFTLMISGGMVFIRSVFRIIEFAGGFTGYIATHEVFAYIFDFGLMVIALAAFNVGHPGAVLIRVNLAEMEEQERPVPPPFVQSQQ